MRNKEMNRRTLFTFLLRSLVAVPIGWVGWNYLFGQPEHRVQKILLGKTEELFAQRDFVLARVGETDAIVFKRNGGYEAFSLQCTHARCSLQYGAEARKFFCGCHGGEFNADGSVAKSPPTQPLKKLQLRERDGMLYLLDREVA